MYSTVLANCKLVSIKLVRKNCFAFSLVPVVHLAWVHHRRHLDPPGREFRNKGRERRHSHSRDYAQNLDFRHPNPHFSVFCSFLSFSFVSCGTNNQDGLILKY